MPVKSICILCETEAIRTKLSGRDASLMECEVCGRYVIDHFFENSYPQMPREKRRMLLAYTRDMFECDEESPVLGNPEAWEEIIGEYERKTLDEKLKNLIWYLRKKSRQFEELVPFDAQKDYPITYSLSAEGCTKIRNLAIEKGLVDWPARGTGLKLTEDGWFLGTELLAKKREEI